MRKPSKKDKDQLAKNLVDVNAKIALEKKEADKKFFTETFGPSKTDDYIYIGIICVVAILAYIFGHRSAVK